ncbi:acyltransferase family protein [Leucobacter albus]|uniref:Acyltransferase family protein n=1 Tax=Leucobacter albus TaxID=272210 RepID=A0ABW3TM28_9MICO
MSHPIPAHGGSLATAELPAGKDAPFDTQFVTDPLPVHPTTARHAPPAAPPAAPPVVADEPPAGQQRAARSPWHFPAVDGLRGLAIASVLLYHSNWSPRGLFGVDVFFVVSGFLITLLLLRELSKTNTIKLGRFFAKRAKRLLPGLLITLALVLAISWQFGTLQQLQTNATKAIYSLLQVANWHQLHSGEAYWEMTGQVQPLAHMWSLSITEQFYIVWPLVLLALWWVTWKKPLAMVIVLTFAFAASSLVAPLLWDGSNSDRLYLGTETRAVAFIAGAALAAAVFWFTNRRLSLGTDPKVSPLRQVWFTLLSVVSLAAIVGASVLTTSYHEAWLYQGGLAAVAISAAIFTATLCSANNRLVPFFSFSLFTSFGKLAYTIYLLHLPVYWVLQMLTPTISPLVLFAIGGLLTWILAAFVHFAITERMRLAKWRLTRGIPVFALSVALVAGMGVYLPDARLAAMQSTVANEGAFEALDLAPGVAGGRPVVLTLGDSLANDFATALADNGTGAFAVVDGGYGGCGIMSTEQVRASDGFAWDDLTFCDFWQSSWPQQLEEHQPDFVVLHTYWDAADQLVDGVWMRPGDPAYNERYAARLAQLSSWVSELSPHTKLLVSNDRNTNGIVTDPAQMIAFSTLLDEFVAANDNASLIDLREHLCPAGACLKQAPNGGDLFLEDDVHFSLDGMRFVAPWLERTLAAAQRGEL